MERKLNNPRCRNCNQTRKEHQVWEGEFPNYRTAHICPNESTVFQEDAGE